MEYNRTGNICLSYPLVPLLYVPPLVFSFSSLSSLLLSFVPPPLFRSSPSLSSLPLSFVPLPLFRPSPSLSSLLLLLLLSLLNSIPSESTFLNLRYRTLLLPSLLLSSHLLLLLYFPTPLSYPLLSPPLCRPS